MRPISVFFLLVFLSISVGRAQNYEPDTMFVMTPNTASAGQTVNITIANTDTVPRIGFDCVPCNNLLLKRGTSFLIDSLISVAGHLAWIDTHVVQFTKIGRASCRGKSVDLGVESIME